MLTTIELIEKFYQESEFKGKYSFEQIKEVCYAPFKFVKEVLNKSLFKDIRLQYFGVFLVSKVRVKYTKEAITKSYNQGLLSKVRYDGKMELLNNINTTDIYGKQAKNLVK